MPENIKGFELQNLCTTGASLTNPAADPGIGGTGQVAGIPGIGGTGQVALRPGIGGTGHTETLANGGIGGTGIVGVVTGFGSICVNGVELHYTSSTPVIRDGEYSSARELLVGQVVAVRAIGALTNSGAHLQAQQISVMHAAVGPLTFVDTVTGQFEVMGQQAVALTKEDLLNLHTGEWVRVSGHRLADGVIRASRVQGLVAPLPTAQVLGPITAIQGNTIRVGMTTVQFQSLPLALELGREVVIQGEWQTNQLQAQNSTLQPTRAELGAVSEVLLQGYVQALHGNELDLGYESFLLTDKMRVSGGVINELQVGQRVQVRGRVDINLRVVVEQLTLSSDSSVRGYTGGGLSKSGATEGPGLSSSKGGEGRSTSPGSSGPGSLGGGGGPGGR